MAKIQFPTSDTNPYWDGKEHNVIPMNLARINESDYYYMDGYDIGFGLNMMTLLRGTGSGFKKVPLDNYDEFGILVSSLNLEFLPPNLVGENIGLDPLMTVEELRTLINSKSK